MMKILSKQTSVIVIDQNKISILGAAIDAGGMVCSTSCAPKLSNSEIKRMVIDYINNHDWVTEMHGCYVDNCNFEGNHYDGSSISDENSNLFSHLNK